MSLFSPAACLDRLKFFPSLANSLDDLCLNYHFIGMVLNIYTTIKYESHPLVSPIYISDEILSKFPSWDMLLAGSDPLRDSELYFISKLLKNGVKVRTTLFEHCFHGFLGHTAFPEELPIKKAAFEYIPDMFKLDS